MSQFPKFAYYAQPPDAHASVGHFFGGKFGLSANEVAILGGAQVSEIRTDIWKPDAIMRKYATYVFQAQDSCPDMDKSDWNYIVNGGGRQLPLLGTTREGCAECGDHLGRPRIKSALVYGFHVARNVRHSSRRCNNRDCGSVYWHNYRYVQGRKLYCEEIGSCDVVFVNSNVGFDTEFIQYIQKLHFNGFLSFSALAKSHAAIFMSPKTWHFRKLLSDAFFLVHAVREYGAIGIDVGSIVIGYETTKEHNKQFSAHCLRTACDGRRLQSVTAVVADGNAKILTKCSKGVAPPIRAGAPRKGRNGKKMKPKPYWNGWFFYICPKSSVILHAVPMYGPENNEIVLNGLEDVLDRYPYVNCFIYDRACKILKDAKARRRSLWKVKTYATDKFHGIGHKSSCPVNPYSLPRVMRRLQGVNTVVAEQTFAWFRGYARSMNELRAERHQFLVPLYAMEHNKLLAIGDKTHLNPRIKSGNRRSLPCDCSDERQTKRARRT